MQERSKLSKLIRLAIVTAFLRRPEWRLPKAPVTEDQITIHNTQSPYECEITNGPDVTVRFPPDSDEPGLVLKVTCYGGTEWVDVSNDARGYGTHCGIYGCGYLIPVTQREYEASEPDDPCPNCGCPQWPTNLGFVGNSRAAVLEFAATHDRQGNPLQDANKEGQ